MLQLSPPAIMEDQNMPSLKVVSNMSPTFQNKSLFALASASVVPVFRPLLLVMIYGQIFMI